MVTSLERTSKGYLMTAFDKEYRKLVLKIFEDGDALLCRNGSTLQIPNYSFTLKDMAKDHKLTLRKMFYKGVLGEFNTLVSPTQLVNVSQFKARGCNYWEKWAGPVGGLNLDYYNQMHPQLNDVINNIKEDPNSRRHVINLWNHENVMNGSLSLPCCWWALTFTVQEDTLHLVWIQRSVDTAVGLPSDVYLAYLFMEYVCDRTGLDVGSCMFALSNVHIYSEHVDGLDELLKLDEEEYGTRINFELKA